MAPHARDTCRFGAGDLLPPSDEVHCLETSEVWLTGFSVRLPFIAQKNHAVSARDLLQQAVSPVSTAIADALFWDPIPSAVNHGGDIYIADYENSRVRIVTRTGTVNTFAGSGACQTGVAPFGITVCQGGFAGDGGPARNAMLNYAASVALDAAGHVYIADTINHRIRLVDAPTGIIYTIPGNGVNGFNGDSGPALAAEISFPTGIAVDRSGRVYFSDENNHRVRMLTPVASPINRFRLSPRRR